MSAKPPSKPPKQQSKIPLDHIVENIAIGLSWLERELRLASLVAKRNGPYAWAYTEAIAKDVKELKDELDQIRKQINRP